VVLRRTRHTARGTLTARQHDEVVAFLKQWLPEDAKQVYRSMIAENPDTWWQHPHFATGIIVSHALRGNGIDERALGVADLDSLWPDLLRCAVEPVRASDSL
jgi:hypothetical protein